jgi:dihydroflavonol-4-reductase
MNDTAHNEPNAATTVLVTGATGYIARHCVAQALDAGYTVRGTARSVSSLAQLKADLAPHLADPASIERFSLVAANLTSNDGWADAVNGVRFVLHVASPIPAAPPKDESELIIPAREGTLRVLRAALVAGVERVVVTSSTAAVTVGAPVGTRFTEASWSNPDSKSIGAYEKSKTLAERAVWAFANNEAKDAMEIAVVNPGAVLGPMYGDAMSTSGEIVKKLMDRAIPACPDLTFGLIDVRDVAATHIGAMTAPDAPGTRYLCSGDSRSMREVAEILSRNYGPKGFKIPTGNLPNFALKFVAIFDKTVRLALNDLSRPHTFDNAKVVALLGRPLRDLETMTNGQADSLIEYGLVKSKK